MLFDDEIAGELEKTGLEDLGGIVIDWPSVGFLLNVPYLVLRTEDFVAVVSLDVVEGCDELLGELGATERLVALNRVTNSHDQVKHT